MIFFKAEKFVIHCRSEKVKVCKIEISEIH
jgi:hypothetical protein